MPLVTTASTSLSKLTTIKCARREIHCRQMALDRETIQAVRILLLSRLSQTGYTMSSYFSQKVLYDNRLKLPYTAVLVIQAM
jgi:hypothetical protein